MGLTITMCGGSSRIGLEGRSTGYGVSDPSGFARANVVSVLTRNVRYVLTAEAVISIAIAARNMVPRRTRRAVQHQRKDMKETFPTEDKNIPANIPSPSV